MIHLSAGEPPNAFLRKVEELSEQNLSACYQCGTCSAGCPFVGLMDFLPDKIVRHVLFGLTDVLESQAIWLCASCYLCGERCPRNIDVARIVEALRQINLRQRGDRLNVSQLPPDALADMPPIALVANVRKNTG